MLLLKVNENLLVSLFYIQSMVFSEQMQRSTAIVYFLSQNTQHEKGP